MLLDTIGFGLIRLSTVLMVVERHNGHVDFDTEEGHGSTFRITLPPAPA